MKVDANGNPITEDEDKKEDDDQNKNTPPDDGKKGAGSNEGKGSDGKNTKTPDDGDDNSSKGSSDGSEDKGPDKEAMKAEILKEMGLDNAQLGMFEKFKKLFAGDDKDDETKTADEKLAELEKRTELAELKADLMQNGVLPRYIDDAVVLMHAKKEGDKQFSVKNAITDFKTRYPEWFTSDDKNGKSSGTGSSMKAGKGSDSDGKLGLGARLAASKKPATGKKSSYWGNK